jgi:hypothetical protein
MWGRLLKLVGAVILATVLGAVGAVQWAVTVPPPRPATAPAEIARTRLTYPYGDDLVVVRLAGEPYALGWQQGRLVGERVRAAYRAILDHVAAGVREDLGLPAWLAGAILDGVWWRLAPHVPRTFKEEMVGLADGSGVSYRMVCRIHAIPTLTEFNCASFAATTAAAAHDSLVHLRNLDWAVESGIQRFSQVTVVEPAAGEPFVNLGWSGFLGAVSGINRAGISIAEITARSAAASMAGEPMVARLRRVLQEATDLDRAVAIVSHPPRTLGYNFVIASAREDRAVAVESNRERVALFQPGDPREGAGAMAPFARTLGGVVVRASLALDERIRDAQLALAGDPHHPGLEPPRGSGYTVRYVRQAEMLLASPAGLTVDRAKAIARAIAPVSNLQSVIYTYPTFHVANAAVAADSSDVAKEAAKAASQPYRPFDLRDWFALPPPLPGTNLAAACQEPLNVEAQRGRDAERIEPTLNHVPAPPPLIVTPYLRSLETVGVAGGGAEGAPGESDVVEPLQTRQRVWAPGSPSPLRPRKPPRPATRRTAVPKEGGGPAAALGSRWTKATSVCHWASSNYAVHGASGW